MSSRALAAFCFLSLAGLACSSSGDLPQSSSSAALDELHSSVEVTPDGPVIADGSQAATVTVTLRKAGGGPIAGVQVELHASGDTAAFASGKTDAQGVFAAPFQTTHAGTYVVQAIAQLQNGPTPLSQQPSIQMVAGPAAWLLFASFPPITSAGGYIPTEVWVVDAHGNVVTSDSRTITVEDASGKPDLLGTVSQSAYNGKAHFPDLALTQAGTYQLKATADGLTSATEPTVQIVAGPPSALTSSFVATPEAVADGTSTVAINGTFEDGYGNPCAKMLVREDVSGQMNTLDPAGPWVLTDDSGRFSATLTSTLAEIKTVTLRAGGIALSQPVTFLPGPADLAHSSISIAPTSPVADGQTPAKVTVAVRDAFDNGIPGLVLTFAVSGSGNSFPIEATTGSGGTASVDLTSTRAETKTVTASTSSPSPVSMSQDVTFVAGPPAKLVVLSSPSSGTAGDPLAPSRLELLDANQNVVAAGSATVALNGSPATSLSGNLTASFVNGIASFDNVSVDQAASALQLVFTAEGLSTTSNPFDVNAWRLLGPWGGEIRQVAGPVWSTPVGNMFVGTAAGVYESPDLGASWIPMTAGIRAPAITALGFALNMGTTRYEVTAGTETQGIFVKPFGSSQWTSLSTGLGSVAIRHFVPLGNTSTLAATSGGVYINSGSGWTAANTGLTDLDVRSAATDSMEDLFLLGTASGRVFRSTDGTNWTEAKGVLSGPVAAIKACGGAPLVLYASPEGGGVFTSTDNGDTWQQQSGLASTDVRNLGCGDRADGSVAVVITGDAGPWIDSAGTFRRLGDVPPSLQSRSLGQYRQSPYDLTSATFFLATDIGLFSSTSTAGQFTPWAPISNGISASTAQALAVDPANPSTVYAGTSLGLYKSTDRGLTWAAANSGLPSLQVSGIAVSPADSNTVYAVSADQGAFKSTDGAATWAAVNTGLTSTDLVAVAVDPANPSTVYAASATGGVFQSTDSGANWSATNNGLTNLSVTSIWTDGGSSPALFASTAGGGIFKSTDQAASWTAVNAGLASLNTTVVARAAGQLFAGTTEGRLFASSDGSSWNEVGALSGAVQALVGDPASATTLYAATPNGVFRSDDQGATWADTNSGMVDLDARALATSTSAPAAIFVGTNHSGVLRTLSGGR